MGEGMATVRATMVEEGKEAVVRFGIIGCAVIARKMSRAIRLAPNAVVVAVGSRTLEKSRRFIADNSLDPAAVVAYGSYEEVIDDPHVDAVYVPLPTSLHVQWAVAAARKGKHLLLEKPTALCTADLDIILAACDSAGVQFMDTTMWMHHPRTAAMKQLLSDTDRFGQLRSAEEEEAPVTTAAAAAAAAAADMVGMSSSCVRSCKDKRPSMDEVVVCLKLLSKTLPSKSWANGISVRNPCMMLDAIDRNRIAKPDVEECPNLSPVDSCDEFDERVGEEMPVNSKKSPSSSKAVYPLRNARKVFSDCRPRNGSSSGRNLMDLMMAPDEETLKVIGRCHQKSIVSRARNLHLSRDNCERDSASIRRRSRPLREDAEVLPALDAAENLDGNADIH